MSGLIPVLIMIMVYGTILGLIIYLIVKRVEDKKKETFEKRDN